MFKKCCFICCIIFNFGFISLFPQNFSEDFTPYYSIVYFNDVEKNGELLYFATRNGLVIYNINTEEKKVYDIRNSELLTSEIKDICIDSSGTVWAVCHLMSNVGDYWDFASVTKFSDGEFVPVQNLEKVHECKIYCDSQGRVFIESKDRVYSNEYRLWIFDGNEFQGVSDKYLEHLKYYPLHTNDSKGRLWKRAFHGVYIIDSTGWKYHEYLSIKQMAADRFGHVYIVDLNGILIEVKDSVVDNDSVLARVRYLDTKLLDKSLDNGFCTNLFCDSKGNIWFVGKTIIKLDSNFQYELFKFSYDDYGLHYNKTIEDENGNIWFISERNHPMMYDGEKMRRVRISDYSCESMQINDQYYFSCKGPANNIWLYKGVAIDTVAMILMKYDGEKWTEYYIANHNQAFRPSLNDTVYGFYDDDGDIIAEKYYNRKFVSKINISDILKDKFSENGYHRFFSISPPDSKGGLWFRLRDKRALYYFLNGEIKVLKASESPIFDVTKILIAGNDAVLFQFKKNLEYFVKDFNGYIIENSFDSVAFGIDSSGYLLYEQDGYVVKYDPVTQETIATSTPYIGKGHQIDALGRIWSVADNPSSRALHISDDNGKTMYSKTLGNFPVYFVKSIFIQDRKNVWINTNHALIHFENVATNIDYTDHANKPVCTIYPNPSSKFIFISTDEKFESTDYTIISLNGEIGSKGFLSNPYDGIDISNLPAGSYFLRVFNRSYKIIKN